MKVWNCQNIIAKHYLRYLINKYPISKQLICIFVLVWYYLIIDRICGRNSKHRWIAINFAFRSLWQEPQLFARCRSITKCNNLHCVTFVLYRIGWFLVWVENRLGHEIPIDACINSRLFSLVTDRKVTIRSGWRLVNG